VKQLFIALVLCVGGFGAAWGCSAGPKSSGFGSSGSPSGSGSSSGGGSSGDNGTGSSSGGSLSANDASAPSEGDSGHGCTNLQCQVHSCTGGGSTTISGRVMDPAGRNPLYNVAIYIPNSQGGQLAPIPIGVNTDSCSCDALFSGEPMATTLTDANGNFKLTNAPDGANIPLVVQIGKWRKEIFIKNVTACQDNPQGAITLPKTHAEGSIPSIAVSTGGADSLECLLERVGVDPSEYTGDPNGTGRVHIFQGAGGNNTQNPAGPSSPSSLWDSDTDLKRYDIVMFSCEGSPTSGATAQSSQNLSDYVSAGGRVFAEHFHYAFFANQTPFANTANWTTGGNDNYQGQINGVVQTTLLNGQAFPEGQALQTWLGNVGALTSGQLPITVARHDAIVQQGNLSTRWVESSGTSPESTQYFSWDMPFNAPTNDAGVPQYCGRVVFSDLHVSGSNGGIFGGGIDYTTSNVTPTGCANQALSADEDALEFILFDLSSCVTPIGFPPQPPPPNPMGPQ